MNTILMVLSPDKITDAQRGEIRAIAPEKTLLLTQDRDEIETNADAIEIVVGWVPRDLLLKFKNLRWFQQWGAGADWLLKYTELVEKDYILTNTSGLHAIPISEHILALILAFARDLPRAVKAQEQRKWLRHKSQDIFELAGKTLVLVGVGAIGERTAEIAAGLGMRVLGVRRNPAIPAPGVESMFGPAQLMDVLPLGDFVVLTIPLTKETKGMIGEPELRAMKPTAYMINIGRGGTIQETALLQALQGGWIAGAGLDVFETEPLPEGSPFWGMDNVILTSHYSGTTPHYAERGIAIFVDNLRRYQAGDPLHNVVKKDLGY
jgi:phosphoglycerate dehydrogenase-like enzyme